MILSMSRDATVCLARHAREPRVESSKSAEETTEQPTADRLLPSDSAE
jgi:hypothetical protein